MTPLRQRMLDDMRVRNFSPKTIQAYIDHIAKFAAYFGKSPELLGPQEIRRYQLHLVHERHVSWSTFNQAVCALRFLYRITVQKDWPISNIPFPKRPQLLMSLRPAGWEVVVSKKLSQADLSRPGAVIMRRERQPISERRMSRRAGMKAVIAAADRE